MAYRNLLLCGENFIRREQDHQYHGSQCLSRKTEKDLQFRQWGRVTGKDQRGEDGNELAKGVECGD